VEGCHAGSEAGCLSIEREKYPDVKREDFTEQLHGVAIPDPYRWLEDADSAETKSCVPAPPSTRCLLESSDDENFHCRPTRRSHSAYRCCTTAEQRPLSNSARVAFVCARTITCKRLLVTVFLVPTNLHELKCCVNLHCKHLETAVNAL
jgi:hypothetical protein